MWDIHVCTAIEWRQGRGERSGSSFSGHVCEPLLSSGGELFVVESERGIVNGCRR